MDEGLPPKKREVLRDFLTSLRRQAYAIDQLGEPYHYYRRESSGGLIDFKVGREENGEVVVKRVGWDARGLDTDEEWAVIDCMFNAKQLTFPEFAEVVRRQAKASLRGSDPFVDEDGDFLRGNREDAAAAREGEYDTIGVSFTDETEDTPEVSLWSI